MDFPLPVSPLKRILDSTLLLDWSDSKNAAWCWLYVIVLLSLTLVGYASKDFNSYRKDCSKAPPQS